MAEEKLYAEWFVVDKYDGSSAALLNMECQGVYRLMLSQAWRRGARLPNDHEAIQRAIRCTGKEWARCWPKLERYWRVEGDYLVNDTQLEIYAAALAAKDGAHARAKAAAEQRWANERARAQAPAGAHAQASAQALPEHSPGIARSSSSPSPSTTHGLVEAPSSSGRVREGPRRAAGDEDSYVTAVLGLYCRVPGARDHPSKGDRREAHELYRRKVPLTQARAGILKATAHRMGRTRETPLEPINALAYFRDEIDAAADADPEYLEHLASVGERFLKAEAAPEGARRAG